MVRPATAKGSAPASATVRGHLAPGAPGTRPKASLQMLPTVPRPKPPAASAAVSVSDQASPPVPVSDQAPPPANMGIEQPPTEEMLAKQPPPAEAEEKTTAALATTPPKAQASVVSAGGGSSEDDARRMCSHAAAVVAKYTVDRRAVTCVERGVDMVNRDGVGLNPHDIHNLASFIRRVGCDVKELERCIAVQITPGDRTQIEHNVRLSEKPLMPRMTEAPQS